MWPGRCADGIDGGIKVAADRILESDWHGEARSHLAVRLALTGSCSDCRPTDQVGNVLRSDWIQELSRRWDFERNYLMQELTGDCETSRDVICSVEVRVHDQALPANCGAWLFEVDPHDEVEVLS